MRTCAMYLLMLFTVITCVSCRQHKVEATKTSLEGLVTAEEVTQAVGFGGNVKKTVKNVSKQFGIEDSLQDLMVNNIAKEGNMNRWGVANAVTHLSHSTENKELQYEVEQIGDKIIGMTTRQWEGVAA